MQTFDELFSRIEESTQQSIQVQETLHSISTRITSLETRDTSSNLSPPPFLVTTPINQKQDIKNLDITFHIIRLR